MKRYQDSEIGTMFVCPCGCLLMAADLDAHALVCREPARREVRYLAALSVLLVGLCVLALGIRVYLF